MCPRPDDLSYGFGGAICSDSLDSLPFKLIFIDDAVAADDDNEFVVFDDIN